MRIKKLADEIINKIAAGEIIDRPASVLKELIENSLDAQADRIEIKIEKGGKKLIEVKDNGTGIHPDDIMFAVDRHATSKISSIDQLYALDSYGFRGEALASIASVSKFSLISRAKGFPLGKELYIEGGIFKHLTDTGAPEGTTVRVKDLFFNIPVRQKFLKSEKTELNHIIDVFLRYAIYHNNVFFSLDVDGKNIYTLLPADRQQRIKDLFPKAENILRFSQENQTGKAYGFLLLDYQTGKEFIYINGRPVRNSLIKKVLKSKAGKTISILFLELPPYMVDHNVHPAKIEVKLRKENPVLELVKEALENVSKPQINYSLNQKTAKYSDQFEIIGQIENTFLIVYFDGEIYFIDQHVASERINYELLLKKYRTTGLEPKEIKPVKILLDEIQIEKIKNLRDKLKNAGIEFEITPDGIEITKSPLEGETLKNLILSLTETEYPDIEIEKFLGEIACELSIEAGEILNSEEAKNLLKIWLATNNPNLCPHGRPIYYKIPVETIKKKVGRI